MAHRNRRRRRRTIDDPRLAPHGDLPAPDAPRRAVVPVRVLAVPGVSVADDGGDVVSSHWWLGDQEIGEGVLNSGATFVPIEWLRRVEAILRANNMHEPECAEKRTAESAQLVDALFFGKGIEPCDCWLSKVSPTTREGA